jgi:hypothetical protein
MKGTADAVNKALDAAVPNKYPETLNEAMRWGGWGKRNAQEVPGIVPPPAAGKVAAEVAAKFGANLAAEVAVAVAAIRAV